MNYESIEKSLKLQASALRNELETVLGQWSDLQYEIHPKLTYMYQNLFGQLEYTLQKKSEASQLMKTKVRLLKGKIRQGKEITDELLEEIEQEAQRRFDEVKSVEPDRDYRFARIIAALDREKKKKLIPDSPIDDKYEISKIYRDLVKRLHPDKSGKSLQFKRYWQPVQSAYKTENLERLRLYHKILCPFDYKNMQLKQSKIHSLKLEIRELERVVRTEKEKIEKIKEREPFSLADKFENEFWIKGRRKHLENRIFFTEATIERHTQNFLNLTQTQTVSISRGV